MCPSISGSKISRKRVQLQGFCCGEQTQLLLGLCQGRGTQPLFSTCGNQLGGAWAFCLEGENWAGASLGFCSWKWKRTLTSLTPESLSSVSRLCTPGCGLSSIIALRPSSRAAKGHTTSVPRHPGGHECLGPGHEPGCTGAVSIVTEEVSPHGGSLPELPVWGGGPRFHCPLAPIKHCPSLEF